MESRLRTMMGLTAMLLLLAVFNGVTGSAEIERVEEEIPEFKMTRVDDPMNGRIDKERITPIPLGPDDPIMFGGWDPLFDTFDTDIEPVKMSAMPHLLSAPPTRGSDDEGEQNYNDFSNGSRLSTPVDSVSGSLNFDSSGQTSDWIDWYKFKLDDIDPTPNAPNGARNITFTLNDYRDQDGNYGLYEYALTPLNETASKLSEDYADLLNVYFTYYDPFMGPMRLGGWSFFYDDKDDTDGWSSDSNWSVDFVAPVPSTGEEDMDGLANGLTEVGWYYVGIALNWYANADAAPRSSFGVQYDFSIDTSKRQDTDSAANDMDVAGPIESGQKHRTFSRYNNVDWFKVEGSDPSKLWNMTFNVTRTGAGFPYPQLPTVYDPWQHFYFLWHHAGEDEIWDTDDDGMYYYHVIFSKFFSGRLGDAILIGDASQNIELNLKNTWTQTAKREVYMGFYSEPLIFEVNDQGDITLQYFQSDWFALSEYRVNIDIVEEAMNRAPSIPLFKYSSDWDPDPKGGHYNSVFTFDVAYSDPDNDPPQSLYLRIDPDTPKQKEYSLLDRDVDKNDLTYSDGKLYRITLTGEEIGEGTHVIEAQGRDSIEFGSLRESMESAPSIISDELIVWNDDPVGSDQLWEGVPDIYEDDPPLVIPLLSSGSVKGPFKDAEGILTEVVVFSEGSWEDEVLGDVVKLSVSLMPEPIMRIETLPDMYGSESFLLRASDEHSSVERWIEVVVIPVNDPPVITSVRRAGVDHPVVMRNPLSYVADMEDVWVVLEDEVLEFFVIASDIDIGGGSLEYRYLPELSDNWKQPPVITSTGWVTMTPRNDDLRKSEMTFSVSDGVEDVILLLVIKVTNTNDPPQIHFPVEPAKEYSQFDRMVLRPSGSDIDPGDVLTFSVNMLEDFGSAYPSVDDQLPDLVLTNDMWDFDTRTAEFWFKLDDQGIWGKGPDRERTKTILLAFKVTDLAGSSALISIELTLSDVNEPPEAPTLIRYSVYDTDVDPSTPYLIERHKVNLWVDPVEDPDGDIVTYIWDLGDGRTAEGININHTYSSAGTRTVRVWASDGLLDGDVITTSVVIPMDEDIYVPPPPKKEFPIWLVIVIAVVIALVVLAIIAAAVVFIVKKGKKAPEDDASAHAQRYGREVQRDTSDTDMNTCPSCGGSVQPSWFICPSCKNRL